MTKNNDMNILLQDITCDILKNKISYDMDCFLCDFVDSLLESQLEGTDWLDTFMFIMACDSMNISDRLKSLLKILKMKILSSYMSNLQLGDNNTLSSHLYSYTFSNLFNRINLETDIKNITNGRIE